ncbi:hypothetical protein [Corynebacterium tapiri]|uniref:Uncharacterized protein n=1 Tax=Corynebacterium tapiri TaxID=1448266 RepID=A0A5C4U4N5_9CORY|nr:hypothetical protein [Corynebacterium tapiri]TNL98745.1 hypothetical protein FHE74_03750 [Corynebacterium tapiri]
MGSLWFPIALMVCATILCASAIPSAGREKTSHPLVKEKSPVAVWWFLAAALAYAASCVALMLSLSRGWAIGLAFIGLFTGAAGYVAAGGKR